MDDLTAFITARLDEDEREARGEAEWLREYEKRPGDWARFMCDPIIGPFGGQSPLRNIARGLYVSSVSDPDRVLREVAAKRAMVERHTPIPHLLPETSWCWHCTDDRSGAEWPCDDIRDLASVWSDHPDYSAAWSPGEPC